MKRRSSCTTATPPFLRLDRRSAQKVLLFWQSSFLKKTSHQRNPLIFKLNLSLANKRVGLSFRHGVKPIVSRENALEFERFNEQSTLMVVLLPS